MTIIQKYIADILNTTQESISKTEQLIAKLKQMKQGILHDLLTRGIDDNGELRDPERHPEQFKDSELGRIPVGWEVVPLSKLTTRIGDGIHTTPKYSEYTGIHFINGNNLSDGRIRVSKSTPCVSQSEYQRHIIDLTDRSILYSINGTIGNIAYYNSEPVILGKSVAYITCTDELSVPFIYYYLQTSTVRRFYSLEMTGSTISNLSLASIRRTPVKVPEKTDERERIVARLKQVSTTVKVEADHLAKLKLLKKGLMEDLLTGRVRVNVDEEPG